MGRFSILSIMFLLLVSCSSLQFQVTTLNHVSNRAKFTGFTEPKVLSTDLFSINAPLYSFGGFGSNYMFDWRHYELMQFQFNTWNLYGWNNNNFRIWGWDTYWRYPGNVWVYDNWRYNIPPRTVRPIVRPKVQPRPRVPRLREPRPRTRVTDLDRDVRRLRTRGINVNVIENVEKERKVNNILTNDQINRLNLRSQEPTQSRDNGRRSGIRQVIPTQPVRSRRTNRVQPRQVRRRSGPPVLRKTRTSVNSS